MSRTNSERASLKGPLHRATAQAMQLAISPTTLLADFCAQQLESQGVKISQERFDELKEMFSVPLSELKTISLDWPDIDESTVSLSFDPKKLVDFAEHRRGSLDSFVRDVLDFATKHQYRAFKRFVSELVREHRRESSMFRADRDWIWRDAIDALTGCICANEAFGVDLAPTVLRWRRGHERTRKATLLRLHARACLIAKEIAVLLESGFADGAYARWRSLHEIRVTAEFLAVADPDCSQRYVDHAEVARLKVMREMQKRDAVRGRRPSVANRIVDKQQKVVDALSTKWGAAFREENGWAASMLQKKKPTFKDIEEFATSGIGRLHYKLASQQVHSHEFAFHSRPSTSGLYGEYCLASPSSIGLNEPARLTAFTIVFLSSILLEDVPDLDSVVALRCLLRLARETEKIFDGIASDMEVGSE